MSEIQTPIVITDVRTETTKLLSASLAPPYRLLLAWLLEGMDVVEGSTSNRQDPDEVAARVDGLSIDEASTLSMWHEREIAEATKAFGDGDEKSLGIYLAGFLKGLTDEVEELVAA